MEFEFGNFYYDEDKMADFYRLSKEEFLFSYDYLTEAEYNNTMKLVIENDVINFLTQTVSRAYCRSICEKISDFVIDDIFECSAAADGEMYSDIDIQYAIGRALKYYMEID